MSRDCPSRRKTTVCFGCGVEGHIRPNCSDKDQVSVTTGTYEQPEHPYCKRGSINGQIVNTLLDTGSHYTLVKASVAIRCGLSPKPMEKPLYDIGSMTVPSVNTVGETWAEVKIDGISAGDILMLVVPDEVQRPDIIMGRSWLDSSRVAY